MFLLAFLKVHNKRGTSMIALILFWRQFMKKGGKKGRAKSEKVLYSQNALPKLFNMLCLEILKDIFRN